MESDILFEVLTPLGFRVRVPRDYWELIVPVKHPVMRARVTEVQDVLQTPDEIRQVGVIRPCSFLSCRGPWMLVLYRR